MILRNSPQGFVNHSFYFMKSEANQKHIPRRGITSMARILIIDDDTETTRLLENFAKMSGHEAYSINTSINAIETASSNPPDLILLDIMMPGINGIQLCKMFQSTQNLKRIPIIIVSALNDVGSKKDAFNAGAKDFVTKPFFPKDLAARIRALLTEPG
jgi:DNA-binding response OmpR family regulator